MREDMRRTLNVVMFVLAGCGQGIIEGPAGPDDREPEEVLAQYPVGTVLVAIKEGSTFEEELIIEGCDKWGAEGLGCHIVDDADVAEIVFRVDSSTCEPDEEGIATLAVANWETHDVVFLSDCIRYAARNGYDVAEMERAIFVVVVAHELGHHLGIWTHVPPACDDDYVESEDGVPICGPAIMNPHIDARLRASGITAFDSLAFDRRDRYQSVLDDEDETREKSAHRHSDGGCVLRSDRL